MGFFDAMKGSGKICFPGKKMGKCGPKSGNGEISGSGNCLWWTAAGPICMFMKMQ